MIHKTETLAVTQIPKMKAFCSALVFVPFLQNETANDKNILRMF